MSPVALTVLRQSESSNLDSQTSARRSDNERDCRHTCKAQLVQIILVCSRTVGHSIHQRSKHRPSSSLVNTKNVGPWLGRTGRVVGVGGSQRCGGVDDGRDAAGGFGVVRHVEVL